MREKETNIVCDLMETLTSHYANKLEPNMLEKHLHFLVEQNSRTQEYVGKMLQVLEENGRIITEPFAKTLVDVSKRSNIAAKRIQMDLS